jgi:hypothetical protein
VEDRHDREEHFRRDIGVQVLVGQVVHLIPATFFENCGYKFIYLVTRLLPNFSVHIFASVGSLLVLGCDTALTRFRGLRLVSVGRSFGVGFKRNIG